MRTLKLSNPFNAPVYHMEKVSSTMDISRELAFAGKASGTVIVADFQQAGRGRVRNRSWEMEEQKGLSFTLLLRFPGIQNIPPALTLRTGLAISFAVEDFLPALRKKVFVKWPNDIIIETKKLAGILCEADGGNVHIGIGINMAQKQFPDSLLEKATSIALAAGIDIILDERFCLLEKILAQLYNELNTEEEKNWQYRLEQRLYKKGEQVKFIAGAAGTNVSAEKIQGCLAGIGPGGELLIIPNGEIQVRGFIAGELR
jgi:BirA family biotin operon repressor/biotin-[acetyl-CoA-carboxylase] ligase